MEKILVTTDQSDNSKAAIRYAIKLAEARNAELIVLHVYHLLKPFKWSDHQYEQYTQTFKDKTIAELSAFIKAVYDAMHEPKINYKLALYDHMDVTDGITEYARAHQCSYICISTRGAGAVEKLFGTHTSGLISRSEVPVLCIPSTCHLKDLNHILYATDMTDYKNELEKIVDFARPLHASVEMMHVSYLYEFVFDKQLMEASLKKQVNYAVSIHNRKRDITNALLEDIDAAVKLSRPSLLVLFTHHSRSVFDKLLFDSNAEKYSFYGKVPLLTFNKRPGK